MPLKIRSDHERFKEIVRGRIKQNLRKYVQKGEMLGKKGKDLISIPVPSIDIPHFRFGHKDKGGVGQGDGDVGTVLAPGNVFSMSGSAGNFLRFNVAQSQDKRLYSVLADLLVKPGRTETQQASVAE